jgi:nitrilase
MKVAIAQIGSVLFDTAATLQRVETYCRQASASGSALVVFPEALLGGYPKGLTFGATVGNRTPEGRDLFLRYFNGSIQCPGPETEILAALATELNLHVVIGVVERAESTLYCTGLVIAPTSGIVLRHRKLMPTGSERLLWGMGDASDIGVAETAIGRIGLAICWENYMPLYRQHLYNQGVQLWCAPTVDSRDVWQSSMRHIACEGRCFVLSACQYLEQKDWERGLREHGGVIKGNSCIVSPMGEVVSEPAEGAGLLIAEIDLDDTIRGKFDLDVAGHYSRPDIFRLTVREPGD